MPRRDDFDAGNAPVAKQRPNRPCFEPGFVLEAAKKRVGRANRRLSGFRPAPLPDRILSPEDVAVIVTRKPGCPAGWWAVNALDRREVMAAADHRMSLLFDQERRRRRAGRAATPAPDPSGKLRHL